MRSAIDDTIEYTKHLARQLENCDVSAGVLLVLMKLRIPTNYDGFEYLRFAILMRYENPTRTLVNDIYPALREKYGKHITNEKIEAAMRGAIRVAWGRTDIHIWKTLFPTILCDKVRRPKSAEFIDELARIVELMCGCAKGCVGQSRGQEVGNGIK